MIQTYILDIYLSRHCGEKIKDASVQRLIAYLCWNTITTNQARDTGNLTTTMEMGEKD